MKVRTISAVLFAKDQAKLAGFYRDVLGMHVRASDAHHASLVCGGFELLIHQLPPETAASIAIAGPPLRRETGAIRLNFTVDDIGSARRAAAALGGQVDDAAPAWAPSDARVRLGHDPEGNVFLVEE
jgi:catechol 2,3-dioxygenase-like lactoylglutathione lyase family enzyme